MSACPPTATQKRSLPGFRDGPNSVTSCRGKDRYSITSSAMESIPGGTSISSARAVYSDAVSMSKRVNNVPRRAAPLAEGDEDRQRPSSVSKCEPVNAHAQRLVRGCSNSTRGCHQRSDAGRSVDPAVAYQAIGLLRSLRLQEAIAAIVWEMRNDI